MNILANYLAVWWSRSGRHDTESSTWHFIHLHIKYFFRSQTHLNLFNKRGAWLGHLRFIHDHLFFHLPTNKIRPNTCSIQILSFPFSSLLHSSLSSLYRSVWPASFTVSENWRQKKEARCSFFQILSNRYRTLVIKHPNLRRLSFYIQIY